MSKGKGMRGAIFVFAAFICLRCDRDDTVPKKVEWQQRAEDAIARIEELGGTVVWEPELLAVTLASSAITDDDLALFKDLPNVELLDLSHTAITDKGLRHLEHLSHLEALGLIDTKVTADGVARLQSMLPNAAIGTEPPPPGAVNPFTGKPYGSG